MTAKYLEKNAGINYGEVAIYSPSPISKDLNDVASVIGLQKAISASDNGIVKASEPFLTGMIGASQQLFNSIAGNGIITITDFARSDGDFVDIRDENSKNRGEIGDEAHKQALDYKAMVILTFQEAIALGYQFDRKYSDKKLVTVTRPDWVGNLTYVFGSFVIIDSSFLAVDNQQILQSGKVLDITNSGNTAFAITLKRILMAEQLGIRKANGIKDNRGVWIEPGTLIQAFFADEVRKNQSKYSDK